MLVLDEQQSGQVVDLTRGDLLTLRLKENPATGYRWFMEDVDGLTLEGTASERATGAAARDGAGLPGNGRNAGVAGHAGNTSHAGTAGNTDKVATESTAGPRSGALGAAGVREFHLRATGIGQHEVRLKHWREWQGDASVIARFVLTVRVV